MIKCQYLKRRFYDNSRQKIIFSACYVDLLDKENNPWNAEKEIKRLTLQTRYGKGNRSGERYECRHGNNQGFA